MDQSQRTDGHGTQAISSHCSGFRRTSPALGASGLPGQTVYTWLLDHGRWATGKM